MKFITKATMAAVLAGVGVVLVRNTMSTRMTDEEKVQKAEDLILEANRLARRKKISKLESMNEETINSYIDSMEKIKEMNKEALDILSSINDDKDDKIVGMRILAIRGARLARYEITILENEKNERAKKQA